jgi:hypothetical protein
MNPGPILIKALFHCIYLTFYFQKYFNPKIHKYFVYLITHKTQKQLSLYCIYLVYFVCLVYFTFITSFIYCY